VSFQVFVTMGMKMTVFWDVAPCRQVEIDRHFREIADDGGRTSETSVSVYHITRQNNPEDSHVDC
jgi:hypothetical protein